LLLGIIAFGLIYYFTNTAMGPAQPQNNSSNTSSIAISSSSFSPAAITVKKGTSVVWMNSDNMDHKIEIDQGGAESPTLGKNSSWSLPFPDTGSFTYHCSLHPEMKGSIQVTE
jgi:plastocyanin